MQVGPTKRTDNIARAIVWVVLISLGLALWPSEAKGEETVEERVEWVEQLTKKRKWWQGGTITPCREHPATYNKVTGIYSCKRKNLQIWAGEGMTQADLIDACCGRR